MTLSFKRSGGPALPTLCAGIGCVCAYVGAEVGPCGFLELDRMRESAGAGDQSLLEPLGTYFFIGLRAPIISSSLVLKPPLISSSLVLEPPLISSLFLDIPLPNP